jgi:hypothetical protein
MIYLAFALSMFWFNSPIDDTSYCGLQTVICPQEQPEYIEEYIRSEFNKEGLDGDMAVKVAYLESGFNPNSTYINKDGSKDRGIFQISNRWHKEVSDECSYDLSCNVREAIRIQKQRGWKEWATYDLLSN